MGVHVFGRIKSKGRAPFGLQPQRGCACKSCYFVAPCACGIDDDGGLVAVLARLHLPHIALAADGGDARIAGDFAACLLDAAQKALVQGMHFNVTSVCIENCACYQLGAQYGQYAAGFFFV